MAKSLSLTNFNIFVVALLIGFGAASYGDSVAADDTMTRTLSVSGLGEVKARPDMATINIGVTTSEKTAAIALEKNTQSMQGIFEAIDALGIPDTDVQTSGFSVNPRYARYNDRETPPDIVGYEVRNNVTVAIKNLDDLGGALDRFVTIGANQINGIQFGFADPQSLQDAAKKAAIEDAKRNADLYAGAAGVKVGRVMSIRDSAAPMPMPMMERAMSFDAAASVPIAPGQQTVSAQVAVVYEIQ